MNTAFREKLTSVDSAHFVFTCSQTPLSFSEHWHTQTEFILATKNYSKFTINGEQYLLKEGEMLLIWPTELHEIIEAPESGCIILQFSSDLITDCKDFNMYYHSLRNIHALNSFSPELNRWLAEMMQKMTVYRKEPFAESKIMICIYEILMKLCIHLKENQMTQRTSLPSSDHSYYIIRKACNYIDENCGRSLSQTEVAEYCGFSAYYFSKIFHKYTQETFPEYLTKRRIGVSTQLLQHKSLSIAEVSYQAGFQSISNFNKLFRKSLGCTPLQYRKLYSSDNASR